MSHDALEEFNVLIFVAVQIVADQLYQTSQQIISSISNFDIILRAKLKRSTDQVHCLLHNLIGKQIGVLRKKFHGCFENSFVLTVLDWRH